MLARIPLFLFASMLVACGDGSQRAEPHTESSGDTGEWDVSVDWDVGAIPQDPVFDPPPSALQLGPTVISDPVPPPISGGTLRIARDGRTAIVADPDRDRIALVDLVDGAVLADLAVKPGDEPGRVVEDDLGRAHVALRRGGAIVTIDLKSRSIVGRRAVCSAPRGLAMEGASLTVACAGGELVFDALGAPRVVNLERDLRDVVVSAGVRYVTKFRTAEVLVVSESGAIVERNKLPSLGVDTGLSVPAVAWRAIERPGGGLLVAHQRSRLGFVPVSTGGYASSTCGPVHATVSTLGGPANAPIHGAILPVDLAVSPDGGSIVVVAPGGTRVTGGAQVFRMALSPPPKTVECFTAPPAFRFAAVDGEPIAVAFTPSGRIVVQSREPARLIIEDRVIPLPGASRFDTGHVIFHAASGARGAPVAGGIACASCHPEGGDDGLTWTFERIGSRRTQTFRGGLSGTEPLHWDGDLATLDALAAEVFHRRMAGPTLATPEVAALRRYLDTIPTLPRATTASAEAIARGKALFDGAAQGCASCHVGPRFTDNRTVDVGTGGAFQVPSLIGLSWHPPFMHNGCAATLRDRFGACGGGDKHGTTSHLTAAQLDDLTAYLESL